MTSKRSQKNEEKKSKDEIQDLNERIKASTPASGQGLDINNKSSPKLFKDLPLSQLTLKGLLKDNKKTLTDIQAASIPHALAGRDILACARTGSGKTLAFLIPTLELLFRNELNGPIVAAIILSPTRELATQIFTVLRCIGKEHVFSAGLLIGGKKEFRQEQEFLHRTNIVVATPGRLLQHLEQSPNFETNFVEMLVLDEADRILDMGFQTQLERILEYIPKEGRQTMLFSATQTRRVKDLAKLSLNKPEYIFVHSSGDNEKEAVGALPPSKLQQLYMVVPLQHKLDLLFSFIKSHVKVRMIVFFATCSQVQHANALFCSLQPGIPILALHGKLKQEKRTYVYQDFLQKESAVLLSTDVASRGLDFPNVSWVICVDAPESREDYIHRVGRTARYQNKGKSLLMLLPSEEQEFLTVLQPNITLKKMNMNPRKAFRISTAKVAGSILAKNPQCTTYAKKAFESYLRSYYFMPLKKVFLIHELDTDEYAKSLGLCDAPSMSFLDKVKEMTREERRLVKNENKKLKKLKEEIIQERMEKRRKKRALKNEIVEKEDEAKEDDFLVPKENQKPIEKVATPDVSNTTKKQRISVYGHSTAQKIKFDDNGNEVYSNDLLIGNTVDGFESNPSQLSSKHNSYLEKIQKRMELTKVLDKEQERERIREQKKKRKLREKDDDENGGEEIVAVLGSSTEHDDDESSDKHENDSSSEFSENSHDLEMNEELALTFIRGNS